MIQLELEKMISREEAGRRNGQEVRRIVFSPKDFTEFRLLFFIWASFLKTPSDAICVLFHAFDEMSCL